MEKTNTKRIIERRKCILAKKAKLYFEILLFITVLFIGYQVLNYFHAEDLKIELLNEAHAEESQTDLYYRDNARLARLTECNSKINLLTEYHLGTQDIGTRCATIRTLSNDRIPYENIMRDIHTPSKSDTFWEIYYDIKRIRVANGIEAQTEVRQDKVSQELSFDINKLAKAVSRHETADCTLGYGASHNNCFGIKHGNTVPCPGVPKMAMCKFDTKEESYEAFKIIWEKWYGELPTYSMAVRWSGDDRATEWRNNVLSFYNNM